MSRTRSSEVAGGSARRRVTAPVVVLRVQDAGRWRDRVSGDGRGLEIMRKVAELSLVRDAKGTTVELRRPVDGAA